MIKNYFKIIFRTMLKNKLGYFLNITGLALGFAAFIFIFYYVNNEMKYDQFHENKDEIYRLAFTHRQNGQLVANSAENFPGVGPAVQENFPEVLAYTRLYNAGAKNNVVFSKDGEENREGYKVNRFLYADSSFFKIFSFPLVQGDRNTCLSNANTAVISESFAKKVFKNENPIGQMLRMSDDDFNKEICKITGVFKDVPFNSHLKFDVLFSYPNLINRHANYPGVSLERFHTTWHRKDMYTYILVKEGADPNAIATKFPALIDQFKPDLLMLNEENEFLLQPLASIHLDSNLADEAERNGQRQQVYSLIFAAILILLIAMINFLNYSIARSITRAKGYGIRKVFGAINIDLFLQFIVEAIFLNGLAILGAILMVTLTFPYFKNLTQTDWATLDTLFLNPSFLTAAALGMLAGVLFGGVLPALILNRFDLTAVVKGKLLNSGHGLLLRKGLITFQISASIALTIVCLIVLSQINYLVNYDLGIDLEDTFFVDRPGSGSKDIPNEMENFDLFKNRLLTDPSIKSVTGSSAIPGKRMRLRSGLRLYGHDKKSAKQVDVAGVDENFIETLQLDLVAGRAFSKDRIMDADTNLIVSIKAVKALGFTNPEEAIGKTVTVDLWDWSGIIVGVVEDYHQLSLKENTHPTIFLFSSLLAEYYLVKVDPTQTKGALAFLERTWNEVYPGNPFEYYYLQDYFNKQYSGEQVFSRYILLFALISLLISGIGLFNISLFTMVQRTKEIGVRKTLGASSLEIGWLLIKDYLKLIAIGGLIACPIAYSFGREWLADFVYSIPLSAGYFILALLIVLVISILTIGFYTEKATRIDPVKALKNQN